MDEYERNIIPQIEAIYDTFTALEKTIADYSLLWTCYQRKRESMFTEREVPVWQLWNCSSVLCGSAQILRLLQMNIL